MQVSSPLAVAQLEFPSINILSNEERLNGAAQAIRAHVVKPISLSMD